MIYQKKIHADVEISKGFHRKAGRVNLVKESSTYKQIS